MEDEEVEEEVMAFPTPQPYRYTPASGEDAAKHLQRQPANAVCTSFQGTESSRVGVARGVKTSGQRGCSGRVSVARKGYSGDGHCCCGSGSGSGSGGEGQGD